MVAWVLYYKYSDNSGTGIVRVYLDGDKEQAEKDWEMFDTHASSDKSWHLHGIELFKGSKSE